MVLSDINSHEFIIIVLNASHVDSKYYNIVDTVSLIDFLLDNYDNQVLVEKNKVIRVLPVVLSKTDKYELRAPVDVTLYLTKDYDRNKLKVEYEGLDQLSFKDKIGDKIGTVNYYYDNKIISKNDIVLNSKFEISLKKLFKKYYLIIIGIPILLGIMVIMIKRKRRLS